ncbi:HsmA family protein [Fervidibacillus halotolerans]|uniref:HsmA family protein n=1 Tax=Fervidibacillus halotolerans TaxID=2980027 RepID=A0A9E8LZP3_9BACI|nr:HsmA family protein [Fervidibacillus halotolerans]WAA12670.1 HsmA family protein [Fervidibacillus halotolerans]
MLVYAIIFISLALIFYSIGVWSEKIQGTLKKWHLSMFWMGIIFDTLGTVLMGKIAGGGFSFQFHAVTGMIALMLMLFHVIWASIVLVQNDSVKRDNFHKFSIIVWIIWLIPYISGAIFGMKM